MKKILNPKYSPYIMPAVIVGSISEDKANFMECTWSSRLNRTPPIWMVSINQKHLTLESIKTSKVFSMNFPHSSMVKTTDYVGTHSGRSYDKSGVFDIYYETTGAPLIKNCPFSMELRVTQIVDLPDHAVILGEVVNSFSSDDYFTEGILDMKKANLVIYTGAEKKPTYWELGENIGTAFKIGKEE